MVLPSLFSRRNRERGKNTADVYNYSEVPHKVRVQIIQIWREAFGDYDAYDNSGPDICYNSLVNLFRKELGVFRLTKYDRDPPIELAEWFMGETDVNHCLDAIEMGCDVINQYVRNNPGHFYSATSKPDEAIAEINARLAEAAVGYQFENGQLVRVDSTFLHSEAVVPALSLLSDKAFAGANEEFREAHRFYRNGDHEQCLTECCKALESTLKVIGAKRRWKITPNDAAGKLLDAAFDSGLIPSYLQSEFTSLRAVLASGVPTVRNKSSGHGTGSTPRNIPVHLAAFQLHQTAAAIVFLVSADREMG